MMPSRLALFVLAVAFAQLSSGISVQHSAHAARAQRQPAPAPAPAAIPSLNDPMPLKAQEHGFHGKAVQHKDGETVPADWMKEYGPKSLPKTEKEVKKSGASRISSPMVLSSILATALVWLAAC
mmetsp:Transcript_30946/g.57952  ORF Transcript_30946/g.57952 Transcript_30946/m.57952 type:complete len:124 (+) Transcript_30946:80-451(+)